MEEVNIKKRKQVQHDHWTNNSNFKNSTLFSSKPSNLKGNHYVRK